MLFNSLQKSYKFSMPIVAIVFIIIFSTQSEARMGKSIFNGAPTADQCKSCHGGNGTQPHPVLQTVTADLHHMRVGKEVEGLANGRHSTVAPGDTSTGEYNCMSCHTYDDEVGFYAEKNCLVCHKASTVTGMPMRGGNVHHSTQTFYNRDCRACHNFLKGDVNSNNNSFSRNRGMSRGGMRR